MLTERLDRKQVTVYAGCLLNSSVEELKNKCSSRVIPIQLDVTDSKSVLNAACFVENELSGRGKTFHSSYRLVIKHNVMETTLYV